MTPTEPRPSKKTYLGDQVYAEFSRWGELILTTDNGERTTNRIVLEPQVIQSMNRYLDRARNQT